MLDKIDKSRSFMVSFNLSLEDASNLRQAILHSNLHKDAKQLYVAIINEREYHSVIESSKFKLNRLVQEIDPCATSEDNLGFVQAISDNIETLKSVLR